MTDPWARPANQAPRVPPQQPHYPPPPGYRPPPPPPPPYGGPPPPHPPGPPQAPPAGEPPRTPPSAKGKKFLRDPLSITLAAVIVLALVIAAALGGELYARSRADTIVAAAAQCVVEDGATVSFGVMPPFLVQHMSGHYTNINIETAGNRIRQAKGMKVSVNIKDVRLEDTADSSGSIGSLIANVSWSADGIKQTIQSSVPLIGSFVTGVSTHPSDGTIELEGALGSIIAKPTVSDGGLALQVTELSGLGFTLPREAVQPALDAFSSQLTKNYPLGIKADSVQVTDSGVTSQFSTQNASIPKGNDNPCFQRL